MLNKDHYSVTLTIVDFEGVVPIISVKDQLK